MDLAAADPGSLALRMGDHLILRHEGLGYHLGGIVGVGLGEAHANLEAGGAEDATQGVDRRRSSARLVCRDRCLAGAGALGECLLSEAGLTSRRADQMPRVRLRSHGLSIPVPV